MPALGAYQLRKDEGTERGRRSIPSAVRPGVERADQAPPPSILSREAQVAGFSEKQNLTHFKFFPQPTFRPRMKL